MELSKSLRNFIRGSVRAEGKNIKRVIEDIEIVFYNSDSAHDKLLRELIAVFGDSDKLSYRELLKKAQQLIDILKEDYDSIYEVGEVINKEGINKVTYNLPRLLFLVQASDYNFYELVLMGIKLNGEAKKKYRNINDKIIHKYEKDMASLISDDYIIAKDNLEKFINLFFNYMNYYKEKCFIYRKYKLNTMVGVQNRSVTLQVPINQLDEEIIKRHIKNMMIYIYYGKMNDKIETSVGLEKIESKPLETARFIEQGKLKGICSVSELTMAMEKDGFSKDLQEEYLRQLDNLLLNEKRKSLENKRQNIMDSLLTTEEQELIKKAMKMGNIEASMIVKDIYALVDLLGEDDLNNEDLNEELHQYVDLLKRVMRVEEKQKEDNIYYYQEGNYLINGILASEKSFRKQINNDLDKIIKGNLGKDRLVLGLNDIRVMYKGKNFGIFYMLMGDAKIIITGGNIPDVFLEVKKIVDTNDFKLYLKLVREEQMKKIRRDSTNITDSIKELLLNSKRKIK